MHACTTSTYLQTGFLCNISTLCILSVWIRTKGLQSPWVLVHTEEGSTKTYKGKLQIMTLTYSHSDTKSNTCQRSFCLLMEPPSTLWRRWKLNSSLPNALFQLLACWHDAELVDGVTAEWRSNPWHFSNCIKVCYYCPRYAMFIGLSLGCWLSRQSMYQVFSSTSLPMPLEVKTRSV